MGAMSLKRRGRQVRLLGAEGWALELDCGDLDISLATWWTSDKLLNTSVLPYSHLSSRDNTSTHLRGATEKAPPAE